MINDNAKSTENFPSRDDPTFKTNGSKSQYVSKKLSNAFLN